MSFVRWIGSLSLVSRGVRNQFGVAVVLVSLIPLAIIAYLVTEVIPFNSLSLDAIRIIAGVVFILAGLGWIMLLKYPINIMRLRTYLDTLAKGDFPREVTLAKAESDLHAIELNVKEIVRQTEERIRLVETQMKVSLENERQRIVIESLGAACHHLGQPATVINTYLKLMANNKELSPEMASMLAECRQAAEDITHTLNRLQRITSYRTEPYLSDAEKSAAEKAPDNHILKI